MTSRMATVSVAKAAKMKKRPKPPPRLLTLRPMWITMVQSTSESSARERGEDSGQQNRGEFTGKVKTEVKQTPPYNEVETEEGGNKSFCSQVCQDVASSCHTGQGRVLAQQPFASFCHCDSTAALSRAVAAELACGAHCSGQCRHSRRRGALSRARSRAQPPEGHSRAWAKLRAQRRR